MTPNAHRKLLEQTLGVKLPKITEPWGDQPFKVTEIMATATGGVLGAQEGGVPGQEGGSSEVTSAVKGLPAPGPVVCALRNLRDALVAVKRAEGGHGHG